MCTAVVWRFRTMQSVVLAANRNLLIEHRRFPEVRGQAIDTNEAGWRQATDPIEAIYPSEAGNLISFGHPKRCSS